MNENKIADINSVLDELVNKTLSDAKLNFRSMARIAGLNISRDFRGANLSNLDFRDEDLRGFDLTAANLENCDFRRANLTGVSLKDANINGAIGIETEDNSVNYDLLSKAEVTQLVKRDILAGNAPDPRAVIRIDTLKLGLTGISDISLLKYVPELMHLSLASAPIESFDVLLGMVSLRELNVNGTKLKTLDRLKNLRKLEILHASGNGIDSLNGLEKLDALKSLDLGIIHAKSIFEIGFLRDLEVLFLVGDCITDASPISRLRQLRKLVLEFPTLERAVDLSGMKEIEYVSIYCDAEEPVILDGNDNLKSLSIRSSPLVRVPRINKTAVNLESVSLNAGRLSDLSFLHGMPRLQSISLIGANDLDMLSEDAMPSLKNLSLSHVRKMQLSRIAGYERIEYLFFRDFGGAELDLAPLSNFSALKHISFVGCMQLANLEVLNGLPSIETVYFRDFDVKPKFIRSILPSVSSIYVNGRKV